MSYFQLTIALSNDAMQTPEDIAVALRKVISKLDAGDEHGVIHDANGNNVGSFCGDFEDKSS